MALIFLLAGCATDYESENPSLAVSASPLLTAPPLQSSSGTLCFTDIRDFHVAVGLEEPQQGWVSIDAAHSEAVLVGTGLGAGPTVATSRVTFIVTSLDPAWDNPNYGPERQLCAEIGVLNACNLTRACWHANGTWAIERKSNPGQESLDECGDAGITALLSSTADNALPALEATGIASPSHVQEIDFIASQSQNAELSVNFTRDGNPLQTPSVAGALPNAPFEGLSGIRNDRMRVAVVAQGLEDPCPGLGSCSTSGSTNVSSTSVAPEREGFVCGYYDHYRPMFRPMPVSGSLPAIESPSAQTNYVFSAGSCRARVLVSYNAPAAAVRVHVYKDGHAFANLPVPQFPFADAYSRLLENHSYSFQTVWEDSTGQLSLPATVRVSTPTGCMPSRTLDGAYDVAVVPFYYQGRGSVPLSQAAIDNAIFGSASTGKPSSPAVLLHEMSRGRAELRGHTFDWIPLQGTWEAECQGKVTCQFATPLKTQAEAALGVSLDSYDFVMYFVNGGTSNNTPEWLSAGELTAMNSTGVTGLVLHEMLGHGLGQLDHAGGYVCDGMVIPGPNLGDASEAYSIQHPDADCGTYVYADRFSPMGGGLPVAYYHTMHLHQLRWISDSEVSSDELGGTYALAKLSSSSPIKQLRVQLYDNTFYFLEYRTGEGMDADINGVQLRLWQPTPNLHTGYPSLPPLSDDGEGLLMASYPLLPGDFYCDPDRNVKIEVLGANNDTAQVRVTRAACSPPTLLGLGASCSRNADCASGECVAGACYTSAQAIDAGDGFACASFTDGTLRCWGKNDVGQLGATVAGPIGDAVAELGSSLAPVPLSGRVSSFALGGSHGCAILTDGDVECWGRNSWGQLGAGDTQDRIGSTVRANLGGTATQLAAGLQFTCALMADGSVKCWGHNTFGQLGIGTNQHVGDGPNEMGTALRSIDLPAPALQIVAGNLHACARLNNGEVRCWGMGSAGQLGFDTGAFGDNSNELTPPAVQLGNGFTVLSIAAGQNHTCAVSKAPSKIKCWGLNSLGQLGYGDTVNRGRNPATMGDNLPSISLGSVVTQIDAGGNTTCVWSFDAKVRCWGASSAGLGQPALIVSGNNLGDQPGEVGSGLPAISLGAFKPLTGVRTSGLSTCVLGLDMSTSLRVAKCWGRNTSGELAIGDTLTRGDDVSDMGSNLPVALLP